MINIRIVLNIWKILLKCFILRIVFFVVLVIDFLYCLYILYIEFDMFNFKGCSKF